ncbi:hypothetical protein [Streptomyces chartreusis]
MTRFHVHIDHVVLDGLPLPHSALPELREALTTHLTTLFATHALRSAALRPAIATRMPTPAGTPKGLAAQIATAVHQGVTR